MNTGCYLKRNASNTFDGYVLSSSKSKAIIFKLDKPWTVSSAFNEARQQSLRRRTAQLLSSKPVHVCQLLTLEIAKIIT